MKELEQLLQSLEAHKRINQHELDHSITPSLFSDFFIFPQYLTFSVNNKSVSESKSTAEKRCAIADVEVTMVESHANIKVLLKRHQKQLVKMVVGLQFLRLVVLHLNVTTVDSMVLYSFSVKVSYKMLLALVYFAVFIYYYYLFFTLDNQYMVFVFRPFST